MDDYTDLSKNINCKRLTDLPGIGPGHDSHPLDELLVLEQHVLHGHVPGLPVEASVLKYTNTLTRACLDFEIYILLICGFPNLLLRRITK
jgi:hypothetical protein